MSDFKEIVRHAPLHIVDHVGGEYEVSVRVADGQTDVELFVHPPDFGEPIALRFDAHDLATLMSWLILAQQHQEKHRGA